MESRDHSFLFSYGVVEGRSFFALQWCQTGKYCYNSLMENTNVCFVLSYFFFEKLFVQIKVDSITRENFGQFQPFCGSTSWGQIFTSPSSGELVSKVMLHVLENVFWFGLWCLYWILAEEITEHCLRVFGVVFCISHAGVRKFDKEWFLAGIWNRKSRKLGNLAWFEIQHGCAHGVNKVSWVQLPDVLQLFFGEVWVILIAWLGERKLFFDCILLR